MDNIKLPLHGMEMQASICLFIVIFAIFLMERRKNPARIVEDASSMYLCGETERVVVHNRAYRMSLIKRERMKWLVDERIDRMVLYILLVLATMVVLAWISLPRLW